MGEAPAPSPGPRKQQGVKRHHHKHNLKHRYELQETLGKGTYGKVKRAIERFSGRVVRKGDGGVFFGGPRGDGASPAGWKLLRFGCWGGAGVRHQGI